MTVVHANPANDSIGASVANGQPGLAHSPGSARELYFIHVFTRAAGTNFNVGVLPHR